MLFIGKQGGAYFVWCIAILDCFIEQNARLFATVHHTPQTSLHCANLFQWLWCGQLNHTRWFHIDGTHQNTINRLKSIVANIKHDHHVSFNHLRAVKSHTSYNWILPQTEINIGIAGDFHESALTFWTLCEVLRFRLWPEIATYGQVVSAKKTSGINKNVFVSLAHVAATQNWLISKVHLFVLCSFWFTLKIHFICTLNCFGVNNLAGNAKTRLKPRWWYRRSVLCGLKISGKLQSRA